MVCCCGFVVCLFALCGYDCWYGLLVFFVCLIVCDCSFVCGFGGLLLWGGLGCRSARSSCDICYLVDLYIGW